MKTRLTLFALSLAGTAVCIVAATTPAPLPRSAPEAQGVSPAHLLAFVTAADQEIDSMNSLMVLRHGQVVAEGWWGPYDAETPHVLYSLTKSFTSTAVGLAIAEHKLSLSDTVIDAFPSDAPAQPGPNLKAMRVRDLLRMNTGQHKEVVDAISYGPNDNWVKNFLAAPVEHKPGTHFYYNSPGSYVLSAMVQHAVGQPLAEYLKPRLFEPLGIRDPKWLTSPQGVNIGSHGLNLRTEEIARFGQLYLQRGQWQGRQLIPADWVDAATSVQTANGSSPDSDWEQGYGYQFWRCRGGFYRADGAFGQFCIVLPKYDAVVVITSGVRNMGAVMNLVWQHLLPAFAENPLPADAEVDAELRAKLTHLSLRFPAGAAAPAADVASRISGRHYVFPANSQKIEALAVAPAADGSVTLTLKIDGTEQRLTCARDSWTKGKLNYGFIPGDAIAASGAWSTPDTYAAKIVFYETPFYLTLQLGFTGDSVYYDAEYNASFSEPRQPQLIGHAAK